jgi:hypothetical protein
LYELYEESIWLLKTTLMFNSMTGMTTHTVPPLASTCTKKNKKHKLTCTLEIHYCKLWWSIWNETEKHTHTWEVSKHRSYLRPVPCLSPFNNIFKQSPRNLFFTSKNPMIPHRYYSACLLLFLLLLSTFSFSHSQSHSSTKKKRMREKVRKM